MKFSDFIFTKNERLLINLKYIVANVNILEEQMCEMTFDDLNLKNIELQNEISCYNDLEKKIPLAFAIVREISKRKLKMRHFDVQLIGGLILFYGKIAEMQTGEGKTLVSTLAVYLSFLLKHKTHLVTVNEYLASRDAEWMSNIYKSLGVSVGIIHSKMSYIDKKNNYNSCVVYGTNNEFGFDYLRDNMCFDLETKVQNNLYFAIIDEIDSILIDEARTPLIISGFDNYNIDIYKKINGIVLSFLSQSELLKHFDIDEKNKQIILTDSGHKLIEKILCIGGIIKNSDDLYNINNIFIMHYINVSLKSHILFKKNVDYIIKDDKIYIIDEHTGRIMDGRRWSDGLHQAVEAKENLLIQKENQSLASITFQNYFKLYDKLCGMTGTAYTEAYEFKNIYNLDVVVVPSNKICIRVDYQDLIFLSKKQKFDTILNDIKTYIEKKQPVLVGTISIEASEFLSKLFLKNNIKHNILNAKFHEKEADIIANAGLPGAVTIATNMAGRGTDIVLGGKINTNIDYDCFKTSMYIDWKNKNDLVISAGGLFVIGTERHESRRIDNQLRGRSGRQGDPGCSKFYLSMEDDLMRIFVSKKVFSFLSKFGASTEIVTHSWITESIENAQKKLEDHNFNIRKELLDFDNVMNNHRYIIYLYRNTILNKNNFIYLVFSFFDYFINQKKIYLYKKNFNIDKFLFWFFDNIKYKIPIREIYYYYFCNDKVNLLVSFFFYNCYFFKKFNLKSVVKALLLNIIDTNWRDHICIMENLKNTIYLKSYAQKDPKQEYKNEAFIVFNSMLDKIKIDFIILILKCRINKIINFENYNNLFFNNYLNSYSFNLINSISNINNNDLCFCLSDKLYIRCHGNKKKINEVL